MDFTNRPRPGQSGQNAQFGAANNTTAQSNAPTTSGKKGKFDVFKAGSFALLIAVGIVLLALIGLLAFGKTNNENDLVNNTKYQAVFVNGTNQVFVGKITRLTNGYIRLGDVYNITVNQSTSDQNSKSNVVITKQGCQLHSPYDEVVINQNQVSFWENLKDDGQVVQAIDKYKKDNNGKIVCDNTTGGTTDTSTGTTGTTGTTGSTAQTQSTPTSTNKQSFSGNKIPAQI